MSKPLVWSERESGDWEACVPASYLIGLVYGGVRNFPLGIYSQAEREALELVPDEPQDYATTDARALARYGVQLRKLSTGSIADAVTRVGIGLVCTGYGGLLIATEASIHSLFYLPTSSTAGLVFDPLAPNQSAGVAISAAQVVAWTAGRAGPNQVREVREDEFGDAAMSESTATVTLYPEGPRTWYVKASGVLVGYHLDGSTKSVELAAGSNALADGTATITQDPLIAPNGSGFVRVINGALEGYFVLGSKVDVPEPPELPPGADCDAAVADERAKWTNWLAERPNLGLEAWLDDAPSSLVE